MKRINSVIVLIVAVGAMMLASANPSVAGQFKNQRAGDGLLRMKHSPVLGLNVPIRVRIDGIDAGVFAKGHVYERYLTPGQHNVQAGRPGRIFDSWSGTLDVRAGETYSFVVKCTPNNVILKPVSRID